MKEIRKPIKNFEGLYEVSNFGCVYSLPRRYRRECKKLRLRVNTKGYPHVQLYKDGKIFTFRVHRLVAETFLPNNSNKKEVNHIDGNKLNNELNNLEWATSKENYDHAVKNNLKSKEWWYWIKKRGYFNHIKSLFR